MGGRRAYDMMYFCFFGEEALCVDAFHIATAVLYRCAYAISQSILASIREKVGWAGGESIDIA